MEGAQPPPIEDEGVREEAHDDDGHHKQQYSNSSKKRVRSFDQRTASLAVIIATCCQPRGQRVPRPNTQGKGEVKRPNVCPLT